MLLPLDSAQTTLENSGGKGLNLSRLVRLGYPVPGGFIVTTAAYHSFVESNQLQPIIQERLERGPLEDAIALEEASAAIRSRFAIGQVPTGLEEAVRQAYRTMGHPPVAVRSSATAEDLPEVSFAGQQDTFLNVVGESALLKAVVGCWSSLWTARAIGYRQRNNISHGDLGLAVVVQEMVPSQVSGVAFTANPVTGLRTCTVIDAAFGLGEALVSGKVEPDHYEVDVPARKITQKRLGAKALALHGQAGGGLLASREDASSIQALPDGQILELAALSTRVQNDLGFPQDIEWALADEKLHLLQSRPITSLFPTPEGMPSNPLRIMFSAASVQGVLGPITPLGQDTIRIALTGLAGLFGYRLEYDGPGFVVVAGERLWLAFTSLVKNRLGRRVAHGVLSLVEPTIRELLEGVMDDPQLQAQGGMSLQALRHLLQFAAPVVPRMLLAFLFPEVRRDRGLQIASQALSALRRKSAEVHGNEYQKLDGRLQLMSEMKNTLVRNLPAYFVAPFAAGMASINFTNQILARSLGTTRGDLEGMKDVMFRLARSLPNNVTTEMDLFLWETAKAIRNDTDSLRFFAKHAPISLTEAFQTGKLPSVAQEAIHRFMEAYGMRGPGEIDLGTPRWRENPLQILQVLDSYLKITDESRSPDAVFQAGAQESAEATRQIEGQIRQLSNGWLKARLFRFAVRRVRALVGLRESPKFFIVRVLGIIRGSFLESGEDFTRLGLLQAPEDIFFLRLKDLQALANHAPGDWKGLVERNRASVEREEHRRQVPALLFSDGRAFYASSGEASLQVQDLLTGNPVSAGVVEGSVRVVFSPHETALLPGEILVCPGTDPAWTPLFLSAGGLIMEVGGMMTHGAVVAREYGIPAVVGVVQATRRLKTGQRVRLDGAKGEIVILP